MLLCGRDWCHDCGEHWSQIHRRRFAGWAPKLVQFARLGYLVITLPREHRPRTKAAMSWLGSEMAGVLRQKGFTRGLRRWHTHGDLWVAYWHQLAPHLSQKAAQRKFGSRNAEDARRDGVIPEWHPHLNVLVDGDQVPTSHAAFTRWADELRDAFEEQLGFRPVLHYQWTEKPGKKVHIAKYVLRATFLDCEWDREMAKELRGFVNSREWGSRASWKQPAVWKLDQAGAEGDQVDEPITENLVKIQKGVCPKCGKPIVWKGIEKTSEWRGRVLEDYGGGYARVQPKPEPRRKRR